MSVSPRKRPDRCVALSGDGCDKKSRKMPGRSWFLPRPASSHRPRCPTPNSSLVFANCSRSGRQPGNRGWLLYPRKSMNRIYRRSIRFLLRVTRLCLQRDRPWEKIRVDEAERVADRHLLAAAWLAYAKARAGDGYSDRLCSSIALNATGGSTRCRINSRAPRRRLDGELQRGLCPKENAAFDEAKKKKQERGKNDGGLNGGGTVARLRQPDNPLSDAE